MKWSNEQVQQLRELCENKIPNSEIAAAIGCSVPDVYAKRSQLGITMDKFRKPAVEKPEFAELGLEKSCKNCAHWGCLAKGSRGIIPDCPNFMTMEQRRKEYLLDRKAEFLNAIRRDGLCVSRPQYDQIKALLDQAIPEEWRTSLNARE